MYSSEWNMIQEEEEKEQQQQQNLTEELTGDTLTEFLQLLNEEDFSNAILDPKTIDLSFLRKRRHACRYNNLVQLSIQTANTECFISNTEISSPQDSSANEINNDGSTKTQLETVWKSDIVSVLLTKTNQ